MNTAVITKAVMRATRQIVARVADKFAGTAQRSPQIFQAMGFMPSIVADMVYASSSCVTKISKETEDEVALKKDIAGKVIGFEKCNFSGTKRTNMGARMKTG